jgi:DMSO/TMAO reductase YedYZ molybdopterin-dependent catalytic subunit
MARMVTNMTRRDVLRSMAAAGVAFEFAGLSLPLLAQSEEVVPFTDLPAPAAPAAGAAAAAPRFDPRNLKEFVVPNDQFFAVQHYNVPTLNPASYALRIEGLVDRPVTLSLADLKRRPRVEQVVGFECSGNGSARGNPLVGNARWTGTALAPILKEAGLKTTAREVVFFAGDSGPEELNHSNTGNTPVKTEQHFARSLPVEDARQPEVMLAYQMNGQDLPVAHGAPVRLIVPGWYGVANVKWLNHIRVQDTRFMNRFMARDYVTLQSEQNGDETYWYETSVNRMRLKSAIARITRTGGALKAVGFALTDGTPLKAVEVKVDDGAWKPAALWKDNTPYSWKLFTFEWTGAAAGDHTIVSRAIDARGEVQLAQDNATKKTRWENPGQVTRKFRVG